MNDYGDDISEDMRAYMRLWQRILLQQLQDAMSNVNSGRARAKKLQARAFLTSYHTDFIECCLYAGFNPDWFRAKCKQIFCASALKEQLIEPQTITATFQPYFSDWNKLCEQSPIIKINNNPNSRELTCIQNQFQTITKPTKQMRRANLLHLQEVLPLS